MTPVDQRAFADSSEAVGDCLSACFATVLDLPLAEVPVFVAEPDYYRAMVRWLDARGLALVMLQFFEGWPWIPPDNLPLIVGGPSPRGTPETPMNHAVIAIWRGAGMEVLHDPHPSRAGLAGEIQTVYILVPR